jgi:hypothetical protein
MAGVGLLVARAGAAQTLSPEVAKQVDTVFTKWDRPDSPGCALGVYRGGQIVYKRGYGMEDLNEDVHITPGTVFHVASMSKQFTAASVVLLAQRGSYHYMTMCGSTFPSCRISGRRSRFGIWCTTLAGCEINGRYWGWRGGGIQKT